MHKNHIRSTNVRFNLDKEMQNRAWQYLQTMDKQKFKSYSNVIAISLVDYFERYYRSQDDPYLENREREEQFINRIVSSVGNVMEKTFPVFLAGFITGQSKVSVAAVDLEVEAKSEMD